MVPSSDMGSSREREKLGRFVSGIGSRSREEFAREVGAPLLVQVTEPGGAQVSAPRFGTMQMNKEDIIFAETGLYVFPLKKTAVNAFAMMVTVGRAANNDIVLPYDSISKFHAYFSSSPQGWVLTDAHSTNGSYVQGRRIDADVKEKLDLEKNPALELSFSKVVQCRLYTPEGFWDMARGLLSTIAPRKV
jgi:hypothetical protein